MCYKWGSDEAMATDWEKEKDNQTGKGAKPKFGITINESARSSLRKRANMNENDTHTIVTWAEKHWE